MVREFRYTTGNSQSLQIYYRRWPEPTDILPEPVDILQIYYNDHTTGDSQGLQAYYRRWSETVDTLQVWLEIENKL